MGITMTVSGDVLRKLSMFWCGSGFTHLIQYRKRTEHRLITTGPYAIVRHPGYTGWAIWAIASQGSLTLSFLFLRLFASYTISTQHIQSYCAIPCPLSSTLLPRTNSLRIASQTRRVYCFTFLAMSMQRTRRQYPVPAFPLSTGPMRTRGKVCNTL